MVPAAEGGSYLGRERGWLAGIIPRVANSRSLARSLARSFVCWLRSFQLFPSFCLCSFHCSQPALFFSSFIRTLPSSSLHLSLLFSFLLSHRWLCKKGRGVRMGGAFLSSTLGSHVAQTNRGFLLSLSLCVYVGLPVSCSCTTSLHYTYSDTEYIHTLSMLVLRTGQLAIFRFCR